MGLIVKICLCRQTVLMSQSVKEIDSDRSDFPASFLGAVVFCLVYCSVCIKGLLWVRKNHKAIKKYHISPMRIRG